LANNFADFANLYLRLSISITSADLVIVATLDHPFANKTVFSLEALACQS